MFRAIPSKELIVGQKIIAPMSLNSKHFSTEKVQALVIALEKHNALLLVADSLQKYNVGNEKKALKLGNAFLEKYSKFLKNAIQINSKEKWNQYKNVNVLKIVRWNVWAAIKADELEQASKIIENDTQVGTDLFKAMVQVAEQLAEKSKLNIKTKTNDQNEVDFTLDRLKSNSIAYQKEELKFQLTFSDFDVHLYPELNYSQILAFEKYSADFKLPIQISFTFELNTNLLFLPERKSPSLQNSVSLAGRTLLLHFQAYITSAEVSEREKITIINFLNDQLDKTFNKAGPINENEHSIQRLNFPGRG